jgi:hypothetical protein
VKFEPVLIFLVIHIILSMICIIYILSGKTSLRKELIVPVIGLPIIGPLMALVIEWLNISGKQGTKPLDMEPLTLDEDILWKALKSYHEKGNIVPLEEAILIDDVRTRRKFMLETLYDDPLKYLDILMLAKNNDDVETSHYATTTISYAQRGFQVSIQDLAIEVERNPNDIASLDRYIDTLGKYVESGLLEEHLLKNLRILYKEVLDKKLAKIKNDKATLIRKLRNSIELNEYASAFESSDLLKEYWPEDEQTWIEAVRVCVEGKDNIRLREILMEAQTKNIDWTKNGKEQVGIWMKGIIP